MAQRFAGPVDGFRFEGDKAHAAAADIARDVSSGSYFLACSRMAHPDKLLLGMQQPREIHRRVGIAE